MKDKFIKLLRPIPLGLMTILLDLNQVSVDDHLLTEGIDYCLIDEHDPEEEDDIIFGPIIFPEMRYTVGLPDDLKFKKTGFRLGAARLR